MWVVVMIVLGLIAVIALFLWLMLGRDAFKADSGSKDDTNWGPPSPGV